MKEFIIRVLVAPKEKITYLYFVEKNIFCTDINRAFIFNDIKKAYERQNEFSDLECEIVEKSTNKIIN